jgi:hypothetical protein
VPVSKTRPPASRSKKKKSSPRVAAKAKPAVKAKPAAKAKSAAKAKPAVKSAGGAVTLKPLHQHIGTKLTELRALPVSERVSRAIGWLERYHAEFDDICGPTMDIPPDPVAQPV